MEILEEHHETYGPYANKADLGVFLNNGVPITSAYEYLMKLEALERLVIHSNKQSLPITSSDFVKFLREKQTIYCLKMFLLVKPIYYSRAIDIIKNLSDSVTSLVFHIDPCKINGPPNFEELADAVAGAKNVTSLEVAFGKHAFPLGRFTANTLACENLFVEIYNSQENCNNLLDGMFESLQNNKTIKTLKIKLVWIFIYFPFRGSVFEDKQESNCQFSPLSNLESALRNNSTLTELTFTFCRNVHKCVANGLRSNNTLKTLRFEYCEVNCDVLAEAISNSNGALNHLTILEKESTYDWGGLAKLLKANANKQCLETLHFSTERILPLQYALAKSPKSELKRCLRDNNSLREFGMCIDIAELDFSIYKALPAGLLTCHFATISSPDCANKITQIITKHPSMQKAHLALCEDAAVFEFLRTFPPNLTAIGELKLSKITDDAFYALAKFLETRPLSIDRLVIQPIHHHVFSVEALLAFVECLSKQHVIELHIHAVSQCSLKTEEKLFELVSHSFSLLSVCIRCGYVLHEFKQITLRNKHLQKQNRFKRIKVC